jgi:hypothetical protein
LVLHFCKVHSEKILNCHLTWKTVETTFGKICWTAVVTYFQSSTKVDRNEFEFSTRSKLKISLPFQNLVLSLHVRDVIFARLQYVNIINLVESISRSNSPKNSNCLQLVQWAQLKVSYNVINLTNVSSYPSPHFVINLSEMGSTALNRNGSKTIL